MLSKRIAVTGASGFIGRYLCGHLLECGHNVVAIRRTGNVQDTDKISTLVVPDLAKLDRNTKIFDGCDVVIHLAGRAHKLNDNSDNPETAYRQSNVETTLNLMTAAAGAGVKRFVFVSSIGVNGNCTNGTPFKETDITSPKDLYAKSKLEAEKLIQSRAKALVLDFVIVRPTLVFGPDAPGNFALILKLAKKRLPLPFGKMLAGRNILSVWNLVDFLQICSTHAKAANEIFLIADEQDITLPDIFRYLSEGMEAKQHILPVQENILRFAASILGKKHMFEKLGAELYVDITKAKHILRWQPRLSTAEALKRTGAEYMQKYHRGQRA